MNNGLVNGIGFVLVLSVSLLVRHINKVLKDKVDIEIRAKINFMTTIMFVVACILYLFVIFK